ncbi:MAG: TetR/AcrR family transcriptional regulator [Pseudomonadota bacterium]|nr:TetR/AcrR family transcriptional regulator [Pseudomonadota bacterium]
MKSPSATAKKRRSPPAKAGYHHGDLKRALVEAARALLEKEGVAGTSLRAAARKAGVSQTAPYHHFEDKNALLAAVAAEGFKAFEATTRAMMAKAGDDPQAKFLESGVAYVKFATQHPALFRLMFGSVVENPENFPELAAAGDRAFRTLVENMTAVIETAGGDAGKAPLFALSEWARVHGLATLLVDGGLDPKRYPAKSPEALARIVLGAAKPPA